MFWQKEIGKKAAYKLLVLSKETCPSRLFLKNSFFQKLLHINLYFYQNLENGIVLNIWILSIQKYLKCQWQMPFPRFENLSIAFFYYAPFLPIRESISFSY